MIIVQNTQRTIIIPKDGAIFWTGSTAPAGWEFFNTVNNYYLMGNSSNSFSALGASTHYHNNTGSTPAGGNHNNHACGIVSHPQTTGGNGAWGGAYSGAGCWSNHTHGITISSQGGSGTHKHLYADTGSQSNEPKYITLRIIKALADTTMPSGGIIMTNTANSNPLMLVCDGTNGTPDIRGRYVKCSATALSTGGAVSHSHANISCASAGNHTHVVDIAIDYVNPASLVEGNSRVGRHRHEDNGIKYNITIDSAGAHTHTASINSTTIIPPYYDVNFLKSSSEIYTQLANGNIIMWLGGTIPSGWTRLSALDDKFPKGLYGSETLGSTGGSASHTHTIASTSSNGAHEHNVPEGELKSDGGGGSASIYQNPNVWTFDSHNHTYDGKLNSAGAHNHGAGTTDSANNLPPYMKIIYIVKN